MPHTPHTHAPPEPIGQRQPLPRAQRHPHPRVPRVPHVDEEPPLRDAQRLLPPVACTAGGRALLPGELLWVLGGGGM